MTVITVGSRYYSLCSVSSSLSHANLEQPFRNLTNKVRGKYICKEVFFCIVYPVSVLIIVSLWCCRWVFHISRFGACARWALQGLRTNLVTVNGSLKHHNTTSTKRTKKNAGIERSKKKKNKNKPARKRGTDRREKNRKKKEEDNATCWKKRKRRKKKTRNKN